MSLIATALEVLIEAGLTGEALVAGIKKIDAAYKAEKTEQVIVKSNSAARQARYREKLLERNSDVTSVTSVTRYAKESTPLNPPLDGFPHPSLIPPLYPPQRNKTPKGGKGVRLKEFCLSQLDQHAQGVFLASPEEVIPDSLEDAWKFRRGPPDEKMWAEWTKFFLYFTSPNCSKPLKKDWLTTWINWITKG